MDAVLRSSAEISVLVDEEDVEEVVSALLGGQTNESNFLHIPHPIESLVSHGSQPIDGDIGRSLANENWGYFNVFYTVGFPKVVNQITRREQI